MRWPDGICAATPAGQCMGEQIDRHCDMEASCMASMKPATKQANRGGGTGAVGDSHSDRRADTASGS